MLLMKGWAEGPHAVEREEKMHLFLSQRPFAFAQRLRSSLRQQGMKSLFDHPGFRDPVRRGGPDPLHPGLLSRRAAK